MEDIEEVKIGNEILNILGECTIQDNIVYLPSIRLDRNTYTKVNKVLEAIGGKWNRKAKGHVFNSDPTELFDDLLISGEYTDQKKEYQYFPTPKPIVELMLDMADIQPDDVILEPSAGQGAIVDELPKDNKIILVELNADNARVLQDKGYNVIIGDFLAMDDIKADKIIMNPPFSRQQDIDHVLHAYSCLNDGGTLVSVMSESPFFRSNKKSVEFRKWLEDNGAEVIELESGAFKESGTMVKTRIVRVCK